MFNLSYNFYHWHHILNQSIDVISNKNYISKLRTLYRMIVKHEHFFSIFFFAVINLFIQVSHYACHEISKSINSINPIHWFCIVCIIISYVHFCELQIRQAFSCPRPILILNLEALLFCFDKNEYDLNFNMHVL